MIKTYWHKTSNFGDQLTPVIIEHFLGEKATLVKKADKGKLLAVGSILYAMQDDDVVWGTGAIEDKKLPYRQNVAVLALRGPFSQAMIQNEAPKTYGDPAILMPLIYRPTIAVTHKVGIMPHYADKPMWQKRKFTDGVKFIDIQKPWKEVIDEMLSCQLIITSSLHGIIISEAYGIEVAWETYGDRIIGGDFKFQDYFLGTGRAQQKPLQKIPPYKNLAAQQKKLVEILKNHYGKN